MIINLNFCDIESIWRNHLWVNRKSKIESHSAMLYLEPTKFDSTNFSLPVYYFGYVEHSVLMGVNSVHACSDGSYRSRGLWVSPSHRKKGIGLCLLNAATECAIENKASKVWSFARKTSFDTYQKAGFVRTSDWSTSETSDANAYCAINF
jgi:GNAT superfamily N-acetyltransferase